MHQSRRSLLFGMILAGCASVANGASLTRKGPAEPMWITFETGRSQFIRLQVAINGQAATALLDTGATRSVLDLAMAKRMGVVGRPGYSARGMTSNVEGSIAVGLKVEVGQLELPSIDSAILDLSALANIAGHDVDLVLGQELFEAGIVEIDFPAKRLRIWPSNSSTVSFGTSVSLLRSGERLCTMPIILSGREPVQAAIDLGSNIPLYVSPVYAAQNRLLHGLRSSTSASAGAEGISLSDVATLQSLKFAGVSLKNVPVQVPRNWNFANSAIVGLPVLNRFSIILDIAGMRAWFKASPDVLAEPLPKDRSGLGTRLAGDRLVVIHVGSGSPAQDAGIQPGDEIVLVDGVAVTENWMRTTPRIGQRAEGTKIMVGLADGRTLALVLKDYF